MAPASITSRSSPGLQAARSSFPDSSGRVSLSLFFLPFAKSRQSASVLFLPLTEGGRSGGGEIAPVSKIISSSHFYEGEDFKTFYSRLLRFDAQKPVFQIFFRGEIE